MSLVQIPAGMTPAQFWASPQGQQAAAHQKRFQDELAQRQGWEPHDFLPDHSRPPAPPAPRPAGGRRPVSQRPQFTPPPPPQYQGPEMGGVWQNGVKIGDAPAGPPQFGRDAPGPPPPPRPIPIPPGQAQPKVDPAAAATRPRDAARNEIAAALKEMFPELSPGRIQMLSLELAEEYQRERTAAVDSLRPEAPMAAPTEQMEFDEAYQGMQDTERAEDRMRRRMEQQLRQEEAEQRRMEQTRQAAARRPLGHAGPQSSPQYSGPGKVGGGDWPAPVQPPRTITPPGAKRPMRHPDFVADMDPSNRWGQAIVTWYNPETGETVTMPDGSYSPRSGTPWRRGHAPLPSPGMAQPVY
jgi:hypothetical protein